MPCITRTYERRHGPILEIGISIPRSVVQPDQFTNIQALVGTGADVTCITAAFANRISLPLMGKGNVRGSTGIVAANYYLADVQVVLAGHQGAECIDRYPGYSTLRSVDRGHAFLPSAPWP